MKRLNYTLEQKYIEPFFVGLFEGDGCIYIVKKNKKATPRLEIALKYLPENEAMLQLIESRLAGKVYYTKVNGNYTKVRWIAQSKTDISYIFNIFANYPFLTCHKICQLSFLKQAMINPDWSHYQGLLNTKYQNLESLSQYYKIHFVVPEYFPPWLSGFIEAEGHFGFTHDTLFYISQNVEEHIIRSIKDYFGSNHKLRKTKAQKANYCLFQITIYGVILKNIITHIEKKSSIGRKKNKL